MRRFLISIFFVCAATVLTAARLVDASSVREVEVQFNSKLRTIHCDLSNEPGRLVTRRGELRFKSYRETLRAINKKLRVRFSAALLKRKRNIRKLKKAGAKACAGNSSGGGSGGGGLVNTYFTADGDVTEFGRSVFGLPAGLAANMVTGRTAWMTYCQGCHEERARLTFTEQRQAISQGPMFYTADALSDGDLAQIVAYLFRFRTPSGDGL